jgi:hypothetical protein
MERRVVVGVDSEHGDVEARVVGLVTNKQVPCANAYVGHGGYCIVCTSKERWMEFAAAFELWAGKLPYLDTDLTS